MASSYLGLHRMDLDTLLAAVGSRDYTLLERALPPDRRAADEATLRRLLDGTHAGAPEDEADGLIYRCEDLCRCLAAATLIVEAYVDDDVTPDGARVGRRGAIQPPGADALAVGGPLHELSPRVAAG